MTQDSIVSWKNQIAAVLAVFEELSTNLDQLKGNLHVATAVENTKHQAALQTEIERFSRDKERVMSELLHRCNTTDLEGVRTRLTDIAIRLDLAGNLFDLWRRRLAQYEFLASTSGFSEVEGEGTTAKALTDVITESKQHYDTAMANAAALVPNKAVLISV